MSAAVIAEISPKLRAAELAAISNGIVRPPSFDRVGGIPIELSGAKRKLAKSDNIRLKTCVAKALKGKIPAQSFGYGFDKSLSLCSAQEIRSIFGAYCL